jgi:magnesium-transporting ATPase (P-type)
MDMKKDIIPAAKFNLLIKVILVLFIILMSWFSYTEYTTFDDYLNNDESELSYEFEDLSFKMDSVQKGSQEKMIRFVTLKELSYLAPEQEQDQILSTNSGYTKMTGLESHPSFIIRDEHTSFWRSQYILLNILKFGGFIGFLIFSLLFAGVNFQQNRKFFTSEVKNLIYWLGFGVYAYFFLEMILYGRMILFLNEEFYLVEHIVGGDSEELLWLGIALIIAASFIEKAIPMQQEQDLTV